MGDGADTKGTPVCSVGVFLDYQNVYHAAREAFGFHGTEGNVKPLSLGRILASRRLGHQGKGQVMRVGVYTALASARRNRKTYDAGQRQQAAWKNAAHDIVDVVSRPLDYSLGDPRQKGVDVALAVDLIDCVLVDGQCQVAVVFCMDRDLLPALELLVKKRGPEAVEAAAWRGPNWSPQPLAVAGHEIRQLLLGRDIYDRCTDVTDYNIPASERAELPGQSGRRLPPGRRR